MLTPVDPYFGGCSETMWLREKLKQYVYKKHETASGEDVVVQSVSIVKVDATPTGRPNRRSSAPEHQQQQVQRSVAATTSEVAARLATACQEAASATSSASAPTSSVAASRPTPKTPTKPQYGKPTPILNPRNKQRVERVRICRAQRYHAVSRTPAPAALTECGQCGHVMRVFVGHMRTGAQLVLSQHVERMCTQCRRCWHRIHFGSPHEALQARAQLASTAAVVAQCNQQASRIAADRRSTGHGAGQRKRRQLNDGTAAVQDAVIDLTTRDNAFVMHLDPLAELERRQAHNRAATDNGQQGSGYCAQLAAQLSKLGTMMEREDTSADVSSTQISPNTKQRQPCQRINTTTTMSPDGENRVTSTTQTPPAGPKITAKMTSPSLAELQQKAPVLFARLSLPPSTSIAAYHNERFMRVYREQLKMKKPHRQPQVTTKRSSTGTIVTTTQVDAYEIDDDDMKGGDEGSAVVMLQQQQQGQRCTTTDDDALQYDTDNADDDDNDDDHDHDDGAGDGFERNDRNEIVLAFDSTLTEVFPVVEQRRIARKLAADAAVVVVLDDDDDEDDSDSRESGTSSGQADSIASTSSAVKDDRMVAARATANGGTTDPIYAKLPKSLSVKRLRQKDS